jgi:hypothetical protein
MDTDRREIMNNSAVTSRRNGWRLLRSVSSADSDLAAGGRNFAAIEASSVDLPKSFNFVELAVMAASGVSAATITLYAARYKGPAEPVGSIVCAFGTQEVVKSPVDDSDHAGMYADEMTATWKWYDLAETADADGNNGVAKLKFDMYGRKYLLALVTSITGTGQVDVIGSGV